MKISKKTIAITLSLVFIIVAGAVYTGYQLFAPQFKPQQTAYIYIDRDDTSDSIICKVKEAGRPGSMAGFKMMMKLKKNDSIPTGRYAILQGDKAIMLYRRLSQGHQEPVNMVVGSVRTTDMLARNLSRQLMIDSTEIASAIHDSLFQRANEYNDSTIIAMFLPDTYQVYWNISTNELLQRMKREYDKYWNAERKALADSLGMSINEIATLASIVDEETNNSAEKPTVAGLYLNRLQKGIPLQADPTVKFAVQDFSLRRINSEHLKYDSPYNTYLYKGLPPGPIRLPSKRAIESVLHHDNHNYIYMCAKEDFSGTHNFTASYAEHMANARKYRKALDARNIH